MMLEVNVSMASVTVRVDADTKQKAANIAEDLGLDLSSVTRAFYKQIVRERRIPLNLSYTTVPPATMEALDEAKNRLADGRPRFNSATVPMRCSIRWESDQCSNRITRRHSSEISRSSNASTLIYAR